MCWPTALKAKQDDKYIRDNNASTVLRRPCTESMCATDAGYCSQEGVDVRAFSTFQSRFNLCASSHDGVKRSGVTFVVHVLPTQVVKCVSPVAQESATGSITGDLAATDWPGLCAQ